MAVSDRFMRHNLCPDKTDAENGHRQGPRDRQRRRPADRRHHRAARGRHSRGNVERRRAVPDPPRPGGIQHIVCRRRRIPRGHHRIVPGHGIGHRRGEHRPRHDAGSAVGSRRGGFAARGDDRIPRVDAADRNRRDRYDARREPRHLESGAISPRGHRHGHPAQRRARTRRRSQRKQILPRRHRNPGAEPLRRAGRIGRQRLAGQHRPAAFGQLLHRGVPGRVRQRPQFGDGHADARRQPDAVQRQTDPRSVGFRDQLRYAGFEKQQDHAAGLLSSQLPANAVQRTRPALPADL